MVGETKRGVVSGENKKKQTRTYLEIESGLE
jgi:hypothetical protein